MILKNQDERGRGDQKEGNGKVIILASGDNTDGKGKRSGHAIVLHGVPKQLGGGGRGGAMRRGKRAHGKDRRKLPEYPDP